MNVNTKELVETQEKKDKPCPAKGRPTTYDPKYCESIIKVARQGGDDAAMTLACNLKDRKSMWRWRQKYPEFQEAYNYAKLVQLERDEALLDGFILGRIPKGNFKALEMRLKNRDPDKYGAVHPQHVGHATQINIHGDMQTIQAMDMGEIDKKISEAMGRLGPIFNQETDDEADESGDSTS